MNVTRDNEATTKEVALAENTFRTDVGGLKGMTKRSKTLPMQSQTINIPQDSLYLHEEVEVSLDRLHVNEKCLVTSMYYQICHRTTIINNGADKKTL